MQMKFSEMPYTRPDMEKLITKGAELAEGVRGAKDPAEVLRLHKDFSALYKTVNTMGSICYVRHTVNTKDGFYDIENDFFDESNPVIMKICMEFYKEMVGSPFRKELTDALGELWFTNIEMMLKGFDDKIIGELQKENALSSKYQKLMASASLDFDGKTVNLSQLMAYQRAKDREVRKAAYAKRTEFFTENGAELDEIFDELVKVRDEMAVKLGYKNYIELGYVKMNRNSYDMAAVERFREQVKTVLVPFIARLHEQRRLDLAVDKLKFFDEDVYYADGDPAPKGTPEEMFESGKKMYDELSPETKEFFGFMLKNELFDAIAKEGKAGGGYCTSFPDHGAPFVFANFNGTSDDVDVLTHECGHALCSYLARDIEPMEYQEYTYDVAEIHSMSMEFFTAGWMDLFFGADSQRYSYMHLASALAFLPYGCMVDEFQHIVYSNPGMAPDERKKVWQRLEGEYKPHLDYDGDPFFGKGGHWQRQSHIYERPFYYIDYCLAQTCALQYRLWMDKDRAAAWASYVELLKKAGTRKFSDIIAEAGLRSPFDPGCFDPITSGATEILSKLR